MDEKKQFDSDLMRRARVIDATSAGAVIIELEVGNAYANRRGKGLEVAVETNKFAEVMHSIK